MSISNIRNIAIIAHVDHGKTTLVDKLLLASETRDARAAMPERVLDSNALEQERGITILSKNTAIHWHGYRINIVDTPGHADFGGEVERVLSMVDSVLLLVDAVEGPMPQTRFVTQKAFAMGFSPLVVINKIDRPGADPARVLNATFDLFDRLGASEGQLDFPVVYCSALHGYASADPDARAGDMQPLFQAIVEHVPAPQVDADGPLQMQISSLDYDSYQGVIGIGRIRQGRLEARQAVTVLDRDGVQRSGRVAAIFQFDGLGRHEVPAAGAGDIVAVTGLDQLYISDTLCDPRHPKMLAPLTVDEPTISMTFLTNTSPFAGREGRFVTSRKLEERLRLELKHNVALRVEATDEADKFKVSGRGELHLSVLIENMRREGYEFAVSRPQVVLRFDSGVAEEPYEAVTVDVEAEHQGAVMEALAERRGELQDMQPDGRGRVRLDFIVPSRALIGFRSDFLSMTSGTGLLYQVFERYGPHLSVALAQRSNGVLVANGTGKALGFALFNLQERGRLFIGPGAEVYEGMIVGVHSRDNDLVVNPMKAKQLTNIRAAGSDENILLTPPRRLSLEQALEFIDDDELVEVTPRSIRLRKKLLKEHERKRDGRARAALAEGES